MTGHPPTTPTSSIEARGNPQEEVIATTAVGGTTRVTTSAEEVTACVHAADSQHVGGAAIFEEGAPRRLTVTPTPDTRTTPRG